MDNGIKLGTVISIAVDGVWAGSGNLREGIIENCGAQFCDDADESENVYVRIEAAIELGKDSIEFNGQKITWSIVDAE